MAVDQVGIRRFQSLWDVDVVLGRLTVIVGASNSGKSAFGRALRAVGRNTISPGQVSQGAKTAVVSLCVDQTQVSIERGKGSSTYRLIQGESEEVYAKAGTTVPEDVAKALAMPEGEPDLHFATQFDGPFLLNVTPSVATRVLGELTNVNMLAEAAREANRRRAECSKEVTYLKGDTEAVRATIAERYFDLANRKHLIVEARAGLEAVEQQAARAALFTSVAQDHQAALEGAQKARAEARTAHAALSVVSGDIESLEAEAARYQALVEVGDAWDLAKGQSVRLRHEAQQHEAEADRLEKELQEMLTEAGECPLCGAAT